LGCGSWVATHDPRPATDDLVDDRRPPTTQRRPTADDLVDDRRPTTTTHDCPGPTNHEHDKTTTTTTTTHATYDPRPMGLGCRSSVVD